MPTVLITGAGRGIGLAATARLAAAGWDVFACARSDEHLAVLGDIERVRPIRLDITDRAAVAALPQQLPTRLDALVNNAGVVVQGPIEGLALDDIDRQLSINVTAQVAVTQALLPALRTAHGRIVFISSVGGRVSTPLTGIYNASKFALEGMADALRVELRPWGIGVSLVEPGPTRTDIWTGILDDFEAMKAGLSDDNRTLYAGQLKGMRAVLPRMQKMAVTPDKVAAVVERAVSASRPKARYLCDPGSRVQVGLVALTPTSVTDAVVSKVLSR